MSWKRMVLKENVGVTVRGILTNNWWANSVLVHLHDSRVSQQKNPTTLIEFLELRMI
jgi:hypothetical protein